MKKAIIGCALAMTLAPISFNATAGLVLCSKGFHQKIQPICNGQPARVVVPPSPNGWVCTYPSIPWGILKIRFGSSLKCIFYSSTNYIGTARMNIIGNGINAKAQIVSESHLSNYHVSINPSSARHQPAPKIIVRVSK